MTEGARLMKLGLLLGLLTLALVVAGCGQPAPELETDGLSAKEVYARLEQAMTRSGQVFHTTVRISQEAGLLSYQGKFELWAVPQQGQLRQVSELTSGGGDTSRQETLNSAPLPCGRGTGRPESRPDIGLR